jgi:hypothetical protein
VKITEKQLRSIIREEIKRSKQLVKESDPTKSPYKHPLGGTSAHGKMAAMLRQDMPRPEGHAWGKAEASRMSGRDEEADNDKKIQDNKFYELLSMAFTVTIEPQDVQHIKFKPLKNAVQMVDAGGMLGNVDAGVSARELAEYGITVRELGDWLAAHGAKLMKPQRRFKLPPPTYD